MRIRQFLSISFTNPFGNLLAAANLMMVIALGLGMTGINGKFVYDLNRPAILASQALGGEFTAILFILQFVYLQWILIGGFAKVIAQRLKAA
jgi:hypothetical protein